MTYGLTASALRDLTCREGEKSAAAQACCEALGEVDAGSIRSSVQPRDQLLRIYGVRLTRVEPSLPPMLGAERFIQDIEGEEGETVTMVGFEWDEKAYVLVLDSTGSRLITYLVVGR